VKPSIEGLQTSTALAEKELQIVLAKTYSINKIREAYREASRGNIIGKSVVVLD
jgi:D-arabinose 1-dehydrogenase-like Zn-dependent alcohol dehydrogenase